MARVEHRPEIKAEAMAMLLAGSSINAVARHFGVSTSTVARWRDRGPAQLVRNEIERNAILDVGALIADYLHTNLTALRAIAGRASDPAWLREQDAESLAALHHELSDRAFHILGAIHSEGDTSPSNRG